MLAVAVAAALLLLQAGCAMGPKTLTVNRPKYNEASTKTDREQLLLNMVRLRYRDTPGFLEIASIATQHSMDYSLNVQGGDNFGLLGDFFGVNARTGLSERPTVSYARPGAEALRGLLSPLTTDTLFVLSNTGSPAEQVLRVVTKSANRVQNSAIAGGPTPRIAPEYQEFAAVGWSIRDLALRKELEVGRVTKLTPVSLPIPRASLDSEDFRTAFENEYTYVPTEDEQFVVLNKKRQATVLRFAPEAVGSPEAAEIVRLLELEPGLREYEFAVAVEGELPSDPAPPGGRTKILVTIRSAMEIMFFLANGIEIPHCHQSQCLVVITLDETGRPFDWQEVLGDLFRVCVSEERPECAAIAVKHRDHWFYIDDRDHASKATFLLLHKILALQMKLGGAKGLPVLTLPVGG